MAQRIAFVDSGQAVYELAMQMLKQGEAPEKIAPLLLMAAKVGLRHFSLTNLIDDLAKQPAFHGLLLDVLRAAYERNESIIAHDQYRIILRTLRHWFPSLTEDDLKGPT